MSNPNGNTNQHDFSFIGEGVLRIRKYGSQDPFIDVGNAESLNMSFATESKALPNYRGGGGNRNFKELVTDVTASLGLYDLTPGNIARAYHGTTEAVSVDPVTDELLVCGGLPDEFVPFAQLPDLGETVTVVDAATTPTTLVAGTDYVLNPHGLTIKSDKITAAGLKVSYTPAPANAIQLLAGEGIEWEAHLAGLNSAQNGKPYSVRIHRLKFGLATELALLSQDYSQLQPTLQILADDTVTGEGVSKFVRMDMVQ